MAASGEFLPNLMALLVSVLPLKTANSLKLAMTALGNRALFDGCLLLGGALNRSSANVESERSPIVGQKAWIRGGKTTKG